jgi:AraC-like DNA-binding protein
VRWAEELGELIRAKAPVEGRMASAFPGLWFYRTNRPKPPGRVRAKATSLGVSGDGRKRIRTGALEVGYDQQSFLLLREGTEYEASLEIPPGRPYVAVGLELPAGLVVRTLLDLLDCGVPEPRVDPAPAWSGPLEPWLAEPLCRLLRSLDSPAERSVLAPLALREIVFRLLGSPGASVLRGASVVNGERSRIGAAMAHIEDNAARRLTVAAMARQVAMSPSHFAHLFREVAGVSPMRYLKQIRLERARALLLAEGLAAGAVAERVGYASASHFSRDFKRNYGLAPARYASAFDRGSTAPAFSQD